MHLVLGIDGGGTKTVAWLANVDAESDDAPLGSGISGPSNWCAVGVDKAIDNLEQAIDAAFLDAGMERCRVAAACFGMAGIGSPEDQTPFIQWAERNCIADRVEITGDAEPILAAGVTPLSGIVLICGTGSIAWGRNLEGQTERIGGWGYLFGDEGSGYAISLAGLRAAVQAADGRRDETRLLTAFQERLGADTPMELIGRVYDQTMTRERIASLAEIVFNAAEYDLTARDIIESAADELARMVSVLARKLTLDDYQLAVTGSVVVSQATLRESLISRLGREGCRPSHLEIVNDPVAGAVALARTACGVRTSPL